MHKYEIKRYAAGPLDTNGYLLYTEQKGVVIDPSFNSAELISDIQSLDITLEAVLLTHGHFDHFLGILEIIEEFGDIPIFINNDDTFLLKDASASGAAMLDESLVYEGDVQQLGEGAISVGDFSFTAYAVPGHTPGGMALYDGVNLFSGDILFAGSVGRADFAYSDGHALIKGIKEKLLTLPDDTVVWPGHGMRTTIGRERRANIFLQ